MGICRSADARRRRWRSLTLCLLTGALSATAPVRVRAETNPASTFDARPILGPNEQQLLFATSDDLLRFLAGAEEREVKTLSRGITGALRLTLGRGWLEARVIFHHIDRRVRRHKRLPNGRSVMFLRDSYTSQVAAYRVARLLGMQNVPPTVVRSSGGRKGSAQLWIEKALTEDLRLQRGVDLPDYNLWNQSLADMRVFDNLINNIDRNQGNLLVDSFGNLWLIDHTRSFGQDRLLPFPEMVTRCSIRMLVALRSLEEETVKRELSPYLSGAEIKALWHRRRRLLDRIDENIVSLGEDRVLFEYGDPDPGVSIEMGPVSSGR